MSIAINVEGGSCFFAYSTPSCVNGRSAKKQEALDADVKKLQESIFDDIGDVKTDVFEENKELTDDIDNVEPVQGAPGPPGKEGAHGVNGLNGLQGKTGQQGQRGKRGVAGPPGRGGVEVRPSDHLSSRLPCLFAHPKSCQTQLSELRCDLLSNLMLKEINDWLDLVRAGSRGSGGSSRQVGPERNRWHPWRNWCTR